MTRQNFDNKIEEIHTQLIQMGALVEEAIENSVTALKKGDYALAESIIENDRAIDDMEKAIERKCLAIILRQQPVAKDLRMVSTALKMVTDLERVGDHAADISEVVLRIRAHSEYSIIDHMPLMAEEACKMVHNAISAFVSGNIEQAREVSKRDDVVDALFKEVKNEVAVWLRTSPEDSDTIIDLLLIAKYFERIGDHAENICEWVEFNETGEYKNLRIL